MSGQKRFGASQIIQQEVHQLAGTSELLVVLRNLTSKALHKPFKILNNLILCPKEIFAMNKMRFFKLSVSLGPNKCRASCPYVYQHSLCWAPKIQAVHNKARWKAYSIQSCHQLANENADDFCDPASHRCRDVGTETGRMWHFGAIITITAKRKQKMKRYPAQL